MTDDIKCPVCSSKTILRTAKKGPDADKKFHVCINYPKCKGKVFDAYTGENSPQKNNEQSMEPAGSSSITYSKSANSKTTHSKGPVGTDEDKQPCRECGAMILKTTSDRTGGLCMPCANGTRSQLLNKCPACGVEVSPLAAFCSHCSHELKTASKPRKAADSKSRQEEQPMGKDSSIEKLEYVIPWNDAYDRICLLFASFNDRQKCNKHVLIKCSGCGKIFSFAQLMDIGAITILGVVVGFSKGPVDSALVALSRKDSNSWICPYCNAGGVTFKWLGEDKEDQLLFRLQLGKKLEKYQNENTMSAQGVGKHDMAKLTPKVERLASELNDKDSCVCFDVVKEKLIMQDDQNVKSLQEIASVIAGGSQDSLKVVLVDNNYEAGILKTLLIKAKKFNKNRIVHVDYYTSSALPIPIGCDIAIVSLMNGLGELQIVPPSACKTILLLQPKAEGISNTSFNIPNRKEGMPIKIMLS